MHRALSRQSDGGRSRNLKRLRLSAAFTLLTLAGWLVVGCSAGGGSAAGNQGSVAEQPAADAKADRSVVIKGDMFIVVDNVTDASDRAAGIVDDAGGRIDGRQERSSGAEAGITITTLTLRIPVDGLDQALNNLRKLGEVESVTTSTTDVTDAVQDVDARIASLESTLLRLQSFQQQATTVDDLLAIEAEVGTRQADLESLKAQQKSFAEETAFSTITLSIRSVAAAPAAIPNTFWGGLVTGWTTLTGFASFLAVLVGILLPWLLMLGVIAAVIVALVRLARRRRRVAAHASARTEVAPHPPTTMQSPLEEAVVGGRMQGPPLPEGASSSEPPR